MQDLRPAQGVLVETKPNPQFERFFQKMNASWGYENASLSSSEKELLKRFADGEITHEEYIEAVKKNLK